MNKFLVDGNKDIDYETLLMRKTKLNDQLSFEGTPGDKKAATRKLFFPEEDDCCKTHVIKNWGYILDDDDMVEIVGDVLNIKEDVKTVRAVLKDKYGRDVKTFIRELIADKDIIKMFEGALNDIPFNSDSISRRALAIPVEKLTTYLMDKFDPDLHLTKENIRDLLDFWKTLETKYADESLTKYSWKGKKKRIFDLFKKAFNKPLMERLGLNELNEDAVLVALYKGLKDIDNEMGISLTKILTMKNIKLPWYIKKGYYDIDFDAVSKMIKISKCKGVCPEKGHNIIKGMIKGYGITIEEFTVTRPLNNFFGDFNDASFDRFE